MNTDVYSNMVSSLQQFCASLSQIKEKLGKMTAEYNLLISYKVECLSAFENSHV